MSALPSTSGRSLRAVDPCDEAAPTAVFTTQEELEAFYIVRALLRPTVNCQRIVMRDCATECRVLLDGDERKPICAFLLENRPRRVIFYDRGEPQNHPLERINDLYDCATILRDAVAYYERTMPWKHRVLDREVLA
jgi:hypothetical protein